jgi:carbamoyltransferase
MKILGITAPLSWNTAAAIVADGSLEAFAEEERFSRIKFAPRAVPEKSIRYCLRAAGLDASEIDVIALGYRSPAAVYAYSSKENIRRGDFVRMAKEAGAIAEYQVQMVRLQRFLKAQGFRLKGKNRVRFVFYPHHVAHAASCLRVSGFHNANVVTIDGQGEDDSGLLGIGSQKGKIRSVGKISHHQSLGWFYGVATGAAGFRSHIDEGKFMGLAAWGTTNVKLDDYLTVRDSGYSLHHGWAERFERDFQHLKARPLTHEHKDLAASVQVALEQAGTALVKGMHTKHPNTNWCFAGGVILNCDMNMRLQELPFVQNAFFQPASTDAGTALGAALEFAASRGEWNDDFVMEHAYWGPEFSDNEIQKVLEESKIPHRKLDDVECVAAHKLAEGKLVGWFQGRMEVGPRALGNRSILAHPGIAGNKDKVNIEVKHREDWRPFAPSVLEEAGPEYFENYRFSPFMIVTYKVRPEKEAAIAETMHVDRTARIQSVSQKTNPRYHKLISEFAKLTGIPVVLNTSFNDEGEPIVCSPRDAIRTFFATGLDYLFMGDFMVAKDSIKLRDPD